MFTFLGMGVLLGLSAGLAPGPLLTLVISQTVQYDVRAGVKVALAPLVTDLPIILLTVFVLSRLSGSDFLLGGVSVLGGCVVMMMGVKGLYTGPVELEIGAARPRSLLKGAVVNILSPHPYLFWLGVGAPAMAKAYAVHPIAAILYVGGFYLFLVGSKVALAVLVGKSKSIMKGRVYIYTMRFLGAMLCVLSLFLFRDGFRLFGLI